MKFCKIILLTLFFALNVCFAQRWGAIYMDYDTGIPGGSTNYENNANANQVAKNSCNEKHQKKGLKANCRYVGSFENSCGVVYWSPITKTSGWAHSMSQSDAEYAAYRYCAQDGKGCTLRMSICTDLIYY